MIVMKFGGTSVENEIAMANVIDLVSSQKNQNPIVVSSATSGTTNKLINLFEKRKIETFNDIKNRHISIAKRLIRSTLYLKELLEELENLFNELENDIKFLDASKKSLDKIYSYGEILSTKIIYFGMLDNGLKAKFLDIRESLETDDNFGEAKVDFEKSGKKIIENFKLLNKQNYIIITQGFLGRNAKGESTTLGRGGSDYSAAIIGSILDANKIEIWTDVDGIMTADPRVVPNAKTLDTVSYNEAAELAYFGAKVLHPATIAPAIEKNIPVVVLNSKNTNAKGTLITNEKKYLENPIKSITAKKNVKLVNLLTKNTLGKLFIEKINEIFSGIEIDIISTSESSASIIISNNINIDLILPKLEEIAKVNVLTNIAAITVVGHGIYLNEKIIGDAFHSIKGIDILMVSQNMSVLNFCFIIDEENSDEVIRRLHETFLSDNRIR